MSFVITGTNAVLALSVLIALNGFFAYKQKPIIAFPIALISILFIIGFSIEYNGLNVILTLILVVFVIGNLISNWGSYHK